MDKAESSQSSVGMINTSRRVLKSFINASNLAFLCDKSTTPATKSECSVTTNHQVRKK
jgi:hypothetical protein